MSTAHARPACAPAAAAPGPGPRAGARLPEPGRAAPGVQGIEVAWADQVDQIEYRWIAAPAGPAAGATPPLAGAPLIVFLHEGLGALGTWHDFPDRLCARVGARGLVFSRPGYGRSTPRPGTTAWPADFMHAQAGQFLPALFQSLGLSDTAPPWLFGHSDGASIALLYASARPCRGVVALAPHIRVEALTRASIASLHARYLASAAPGAPPGGLRSRLARQHADVDASFFGWSGAWLAPAFQAWQIASDVARIACPLLAIQGEDDEYGTLAQIEEIARLCPHTTLLKLPDCGHAPQREQGPAVLAAVDAFMRRPALPAAPCF